MSSAILNPKAEPAQGAIVRRKRPLRASPYAAPEEGCRWISVGSCGIALAGPGFAAPPEPLYAGAPTGTGLQPLWQPAPPPPPPICRQFLDSYRLLASPCDAKYAGGQGLGVGVACGPYMSTRLRRELTSWSHTPQTEQPKASGSLRAGDLTMAKASASKSLRV